MCCRRHAASDTKPYAGHAACALLLTLPCAQLHHPVVFCTLNLCKRREWGGVVPTLAKEAHAAAIDSTVEAALSQAGITAAQLAAVAVTVGPGLSMCLQASKAE